MTSDAVVHLTTASLYSFELTSNVKCLVIADFFADSMGFIHVFITCCVYINPRNITNVAADKILKFYHCLNSFLTENP